MIVCPKCRKKASSTCMVKKVNRYGTVYVYTQYYHGKKWGSRKAGKTGRDVRCFVLVSGKQEQGVQVKS